MSTVTSRSRRQRARRAQHLALVLERESVAGFDFDRGDALGEQSVEPGRRLATNSASLAARVAFTVETMPPPLRAMAS